MFNNHARILTRAHNLSIQFIFNTALLCGLSGNAVANSPPRSNAGADQSVAEHELVHLDGSNSSDTDGEISSYRWFQTRGPSVSLSDHRAMVTQFEAPPNSQLEFRLRVIDDSGEKDSDRILIQVEPYTNQPPAADAGSDQSAAPGTTYSTKQPGQS